MSGTSNHNRLFGRALFMDVRDLVNASTVPLGNYEIRNLLAAGHHLDAAGMLQLYQRVCRCTEQLYTDGYLQRTETMGENRHVKYLYTRKTPADVRN